MLSQNLPALGVIHAGDGCDAEETFLFVEKLLGDTCPGQ